MAINGGTQVLRRAPDAVDKLAGIHIKTSNTITLVTCKVQGLSVGAQCMSIQKIGSCVDRLCDHDRLFPGHSLSGGVSHGQRIIFRHVRNVDQAVPIEADIRCVVVDGTAVVDDVRQFSQFGLPGEVQRAQAGCGKKENSWLHYLKINKSESIGP